PHDLHAPAALGAAVLRAVRRAGRARGGGTAAGRRAAGRPGVPREVRLAGETSAASVRPGDDVVVAPAAGVLRRVEARADLGVLAAGTAHLPPPDAGADVAAPGGARAGPGDLRTIRRREVGRGRPHLLPGGGEAGRVILRRTAHRSGVCPLSIVRKRTKRKASSTNF